MSDYSALQFTVLVFCSSVLFFHRDPTESCFYKVPIALVRLQFSVVPGGNLRIFSFKANPGYSNLRGLESSMYLFLLLLRCVFTVKLPKAPCLLPTLC